MTSNPARLTFAATMIFMILPAGLPPTAAQELGQAGAAAFNSASPAASEDGATSVSSPPARLPVAEASDLLGNWILKVTTFRGDNYVDFRASDEDGFVLATFSLPPPMTVDPIREITRDGDALIMKFILNFGSSAIDMTMRLQAGDGRYAGTLVDANNMFNSPVSLLTPEQAEAEKAAVAAAAAAATSDGGDGGTDDAEAKRETNSLDFGDRSISIQFSATKPVGDDYDRLATLPQGEVVRYTADFATKLITDVPLMFGDTLLATENVAKDYPGVYSLWLEKTAEGWALRSNHRPDVWGTQHSPDADGPAIPLTHEVRAGTAATLHYSLEPEGDDRGALRIEWGEHVWQAEFTLAP